MKKLIYVLIFVLLAAGVTACGSKSSGSSANEAEETQNKETSDKKNSGSDNEYWIYPGADELVEVPMGTCIDGVQTELCTVKVPKNYYVFFMYTDENGKQHTMADSTTLETILQSGQLDKGQVPSLVGFGTLNFSIVKYDESWANFLEQEPGQIEVEAPEGCKCYVYPPEEEFDWLSIYYVINDKWMFIGSYSWDSEKDKAPEEFAKQLIKLVTLK